MHSSLQVLIAGAGIGGLAAALALVRRGFTVKVLEQAPEIGEIGAGIQLGPNAFHAFDAGWPTEQTQWLDCGPRETTTRPRCPATPPVEPIAETPLAHSPPASRSTARQTTPAARPIGRATVAILPP